MLDLYLSHGPKDAGSKFVFLIVVVGVLLHLLVYLLHNAGV